MRVVRTLLSAAACAVALGACTGAGPAHEERPVDQSTPNPPSTGSSDPSSPPSSTPLAGTVGLAVADLSARLGVEAVDVEVVSQESVTWRDGSRGCAQPGTSYTQSLIQGSRMVLRAGGRTYEYHSGGSRPPFLCERPTQ